MTIFKDSFLVLLIIQIVHLSSCNEDLEGYDQIINPIWEYNYGVGGTLSIEPIIFNNKVLYSGAKERSSDIGINDRLIALDKEKGELLWEWSDFLRPTSQRFSYNSLKPIYNNWIAITIGGRNHLIDLETGKTVWKNQNNGSTSRSDLSITGNRLIRTDVSLPNPPYVERLMEADINTGIWKEVYKVEGGDSIRQGLEVPSFYIEDDGDTLLVFSNTEAWFEKNVIIPNLLCYNQTKDSLYYDILLGEPAVGNAVDWFPEIFGDRVYLSVNRRMVCHHVLTGELIWERELNANILGSNFIIVDDHIYTQTEGWEPSLWKIDAINGDIVWSSPSRGGNSFLNYYEGKIYQVTGGRLKVVDAMSGTELASIKAPSSYADDNDFFSGRCTVDPETGYVYVTSFSTAYCYPSLE